MVSFGSLLATPLTPSCALYCTERSSTSAFSPSRICSQDLVHWEWTSSGAPWALRRNRPLDGHRRALQGCRAQVPAGQEGRPSPTNSSSHDSATPRPAVEVIPTPNLVADVGAHPTQVWSRSSAPASLVAGRPTGGSLGYRGATDSLVPDPLLTEKRIVLVRHGLSSWNEECRVQGSSDKSVLSPQGRVQAVQCREALRFIPFDCCFASPISRARTSAELMWEGRDGPLVFLDCLREANLLFLEGMLNSDAKAQHPEEYRAWREDPANFSVEGVFPVRRLWDQAREAWRAILTHKGNTILVVTHKSLLRALVCTSLGMGPERFRAIDVNNGGICVMRVSRKGEPMLESLNLTAHLQCESVHYNS